MANKIKDGNQSDFSSNQGYLVPKFGDRGIAQSTTDAVTYKDASKYMENQTADLLTAGVTDQRDTFQAPQIIGPAKFDEFGGVKLDKPNGQVVDPRVWAVNNGRKFLAGGVRGNTDALIVARTISSDLQIVTAGTASDGSDSDGECRIVATTVAAGSDCYLTLNGPSAIIFKPPTLLYMYFKFKLRDASGYRFWTGFTAGDPRGSDTVPVDSMMVRYSSGAGDSAFQLVGRAAGGQTVVNTGVTVSTGVLYELELWCDTSAIYARINNGAIVRNTTLPTSTTSLGGWAGFAMRSVTAGTEYGIRSYAIYFSQN